MNKKIAISFSIILIWLGIIFYFSGSDAKASTDQTFLAIDILKGLSDKYPFFEMISNKLTENHSLVYSIRKLAHLTIFCILQMIVFLILRINKVSLLKSCIYSIVFVIFSAIFDEIHQYFTPGRSAQVKDVIIDTIGGCIGMMICLSIHYIKYYIFKLIKRYE